jgi:large subunit ribosomal protein L10
LAISKLRKEELVAQYVEWFDQSRAMIVTEYSGLSMKDIDELRAKLREIGSEFHIVKNTLGKVAFDSAGRTVPEEFLDGTTAMVFAFEDGPATAKAFMEFAKERETVKVKGGFLENDLIGPDEVTALSELPPLPVMRAQLLGTIMAPASKLVRTLAEPARQVAVDRWLL